MIWQPVADPLPPQAAIAHGAAARRLLDRLAALPLDGLSATANADCLVVFGPEEKLPWSPGIAYAAPCPEAPALWLPTVKRPDLPCDLIEAALLRRHGRHPLLLWPDPAEILPLDRQMPLSDDLLARIAALWS